MEILIILCVFLLAICICIIAKGVRPKTSSCSIKGYPEYYKDVWITFKFPNENLLHTKKAWLSSDGEKYIWTISDSNIIITDDWVISWKQC